MEQEVRWRLRRLKYRHLVFLAESSATYMQERDSQELLAELLVHLERRWAEIEDCRMVVSMMAKIGHLSEPLMNRLEDKCLELVEQFGPDELRKVLLTLATQNRRSVPLLRAIFTWSRSPSPDERHPPGPGLRLWQTRLPADPGVPAPCI